MDYRDAIACNNQVTFPLKFNNIYWGLVPSEPEDWPLEREIRIHGVALSNSGKELLKIVEIASDQAYLDALIGYFRWLGMELTRLNNA